MQYSLHAMYTYGIYCLYVYIILNIYIPGIYMCIYIERERSRAHLSLWLVSGACVPDVPPKRAIGSTGGAKDDDALIALSH